MQDAVTTIEVADLPHRPPSAGRELWRGIARNAFPFAVVGTLWEIVAWAGVFPHRLFPTLEEVATLSAGPVGIADPIGSINGENLLHAVRRDGVIVKPDVPLTPTDASYSNMAHSANTPQIAFAWSDFGALRTNYAFAFAHAGPNTLAKFSPADFGIDAPVYVYDYFAGMGQLVDPSDTIQKPIPGDALYLVLAPVGPSGIAIVGDTDQFVTMGKKRVGG